MWVVVKKVQIAIIGIMHSLPSEPGNAIFLLRNPFAMRLNSGLRYTYMYISKMVWEQKLEQAEKTNKYK